MDSNAAILFAWSYGLAGFGYAAFALYLVFHGQHWSGGSRTRALVAASIFASIWGASELTFSLTAQPGFLAAGLFADILRYGGWYSFILLLIRPEKDQRATAVEPAFWLTPAAIVIVVLGLFANALNILGIGPAGSLNRPILFQALAMIVLALVLLEQLFRNVSADSRWNIKPLCLGLAGAFLFDLYLYADALLFNHLDTDGFIVRGFVHALAIPLLVLSTVRSRDWIARIRLSQKAAFHSAALLIAGTYLLFIAAVGYYVRYSGGDWGRALQLALLFVGLLILGLLVLSGSMRAKLKVLLGKHFFSYRYDYREEWLRFTQALSVQDSPQAMGQQVIRVLADMLESPAGSLWLKNAGQKDYIQAARWNMPAVGALEDAETPLCRFLVESGWVINLEEFRAYPGRYASLELPEWLSEVPNAWLIIPLVAVNDMIGFVILASARTPIDVNWEVNDLLRTAGRQAASFLAQMQATEALLEVRKFDAFNRMSAFVVHDLKNIVTQLSLMLKNAERHRDNPEFQQDMLMTVEHSVERMRQLMLQLREGATPHGTTVGVDLEETIRRIQAAKASQGHRVEIEIEDRLTARGHEERIERVIGHLVQNALDAIDNDGRVWVKLVRQGGLAKVEVCDNGHGMSAEFLRERLFRPFQTTKQAGMGIGAYESSQYVQELGGKMLVESEVNVGTRVTMLLPLFHVGTKSDLQEEAA